MRGKVILLTGLAVGYVLGAKAGRPRYESIKKSAAKLWNDPRVQTQVDRVEDFAKDKAPEVAEYITDGAKKVASQVGKVKSGKSGKSDKSSSGSKKSGSSKSVSSKSDSGDSESSSSSSTASKESGTSGGGSAASSSSQ